MEAHVKTLAHHGLKRMIRIWVLAHFQMHALRLALELQFTIIARRIYQRCRFAYLGQTDKNFKGNMKLEQFGIEL